MSTSTATSPGASPRPDGAGVEHRVGPLAAIPPGEGRAFAVDGRQVAVFHVRGGGVRAVDAVCPHRGGPLADGLVDASVVVCPLHAHEFELATGDCRTGAPPVTTYPARVDGGDVLVVVPADGA